MTIEKIVRLLAEYMENCSHSLSTAESCTGGMIAKLITDQAGSSNWFDRGFITYSNQAKIDCLGVKLEEIQQYGAVSEQVVRAMAQGAIAHSEAEYSIAVTGIAGPGGGSLEKPVGTVWIACSVQNQLFAECRQFSGNREQVREQSAFYALELLLRLVSDK